MEPENIDWDNIDSIFIKDEKYENFEAPKWVDLSALDQIPVAVDELWFCNHNCKHPKTAEDFLKPKTSTTSKSKLLRLVTISEILPFRDRNRRGNYSATEGFYAKLSDKSRRLSCSENLHEEDNENKNPNLSAPIPSGNRSNKPKKPPLLVKQDSNKENPKHLNNGSMECPPKSSSGRKSQLKSTCSAQNLMGGREILSQISGFCSELKRLAMKGTYKKGSSEKGSSQNENGVSQQ